MYKLNLFKSAFELSQPHSDKTATHAQWSTPETLNLLHRAGVGHGSKPLFLLHDGPPYANGSLHLGHFVNKSLKDALLKFKRLEGYFAPFVPGFDCHGLPVELEVEKQGHLKADPVAFVSACRTYALSQVAAQAAEFQAFGVSADWENAYRTLDPSFEAEAATVFTQLQGVVKRLRPVHWCPACASSLAEAEVAYRQRESDSLVVLFKLRGRANTYLQVWTTTPYTLPANKAVAFNPSLSYVEVTDGDRVLVRTRREDDSPELPEVPLAGLTATSPYTGAAVPLLPADYVSGAGTGLVHLAPSFGTDDFRVGEAHGLPVEFFVDEKGRFVSGEMAGMNFVQATEHVLERVAGLVFSLDKVRHEFPHCWRHQKPLFFKASEEWFLDLTDLRDKALVALEAVEFVPSASRDRLGSMLGGRSSWCLSRTRLWGTPLVDLSCPEDVDLLGRVAEEGVEAWQSRGARRTLDVWFDSGVTHEVVLRRRFGRTADVYLEGSDQHRGWFQSSLLTAVAAGGPAPFKSLLTHGFVVDEQGCKYSKSSGNYRPLAELFKAHSPDVLRLWALAQDFTKDFKMSKVALDHSVDRYRKLRNTLRFCLQNTADYNFVPVELTHAMHQHQAGELLRLVSEVSQASKDYNFSAAVSSLTRYSEAVSGDYFTALKDTLYCDEPNAPRRREAQFVLGKVLETLMHLLVPVLPYTAEELFQEVRVRLGYTESTSLLLTLATLKLPLAPDRAEVFEQLKQLKQEVNRHVEANRGVGLKSAAQLDLKVAMPNPLAAAELVDYFGAAKVTVHEGSYQVVTARYPALLCVRCRRHDSSVTAQCCTRCLEAEAYATSVTE